MRMDGSPLLGWRGKGPAPAGRRRRQNRDLLPGAAADRIRPQGRLRPCAIAPMRRDDRFHLLDEPGTVDIGLDRLTEPSRSETEIRLKDQPCRR
jgi:hypothetical protein